MFQVSRPYLGFCPDPKHFIVNCEQNTVKFAEKNGRKCIGKCKFYIKYFNKIKCYGDQPYLVFYFGFLLCRTLLHYFCFLNSSKNDTIILDNKNYTAGKPEFISERQNSFLKFVSSVVDFWMWSKLSYEWGVVAFGASCLRVQYTRTLGCCLQSTCALRHPNMSHAWTYETCVWNRVKWEFATTSIGTDRMCKKLIK